MTIRDVLLEMRKNRMGLIQTPDQLKFSYIAIAAGATQAGLVESNKLSEICQQSPRNDSSSDSSDDDMGPPPLPPPRSESLKAREFANLKELLESGVDGYLKVCDDDDDETPHPKSAGAILTSDGDTEPLIEHKHLTNSMSAGAAPSSPSKKCILNNHKLEERKR